jgi:hypothetical protein
MKNAVMEQRELYIMRGEEQLGPQTRPDRRPGI